MKKKFISLLLSLTPLLFCSPALHAQNDKPYKEGPVWTVDFVQTKPGMGEAYLKNLSENWLKMMQEAKRQDLIMDFKLLTSDAATPSDWNIMFLVEYKNYAALDGLSDKFDAVEKKVMGSAGAGAKVTVSLNDMRQFIGSKLAQELIFK